MAMLICRGKMYKLKKFDFADQKVFDGRKTVTEWKELSCSEKYPIISNGKRFKKDSRKWLHKSSDKKECHSKDVDVHSKDCSMDVLVGSDDASDSCNGTNHRKSISALRCFLQSDYNNETKITPVKSCLKNMHVEENAHGPEMFRRKNKRRLKSPTMGNQYSVRFDDSDNEKLKNFIAMSRSFKPIRPEELSFRNDNGVIEESKSDTSLIISNTDYSGTNTITNLVWNSQDSNIWRQSKIVPSDGSTTPTQSSSPPTSPVPLKRTKTHQQAKEVNIDGRLFLISTPSDSTLDFDETPCPSPCISLSLEDSILQSNVVISSKRNFSNSN